MYIANSLKSVASAAILSLLCATPAIAAPSGAVVLGDDLRCGAGNATFISVTDVTGNAGGATDCWGAYQGNDPGPSGDGFEIDSSVLQIDGLEYNFVTKEDVNSNASTTRTGQDIGLEIGGLPGTSGSWSFDSSIFAPASYLIVLKAANNPGFGAWLFAGADALSDAGTWAVAWTTGNNGSTPALSHFSIYASNGGPPTTQTPVPATWFLLLAGIAAILMRRK